LCEQQLKEYCLKQVAKLDTIVCIVCWHVQIAVAEAAAFSLAEYGKRTDWKVRQKPATTLLHLAIILACGSGLMPTKVLQSCHFVPGKHHCVASLADLLSFRVDPEAKLSRSCCKTHPKHLEITSTGSYHVSNAKGLALLEKKSCRANGCHLRSHPCKLEQQTKRGHLCAKHCR
jgi:hypothetical protein